MYLYIVVMEAFLKPEISLYQAARNKFEENILVVLESAADKEKANLYAGLSAFTVAVENHLTQILDAVQKNKT